MSLTISNQAKYQYDNYAFKTSTAYKKNSVDSSNVSSKNYNVSNISNALDSLEKANSVSFDSINNVSSYAKNSYKLSQLNSYKTLTNSNGTGINRLLNGEAGANDIYGIMSYTNSLLVSAAERYSGISSSDYSNYLSETGNIIDILV